MKYACLKRYRVWNLQLNYKTKSEIIKLSEIVSFNKLSCTWF